MPARKIAIDKCTHCLPYAAIAPRTATVVVAADDASDEQKDQADYVCDGVADEVELQAALDAVPATGGTVILQGAIFNLSNKDYDEDALTISNDHTILHSPSFAEIKCNVLYGGYVVDILADYVKLSNLKLYQTGTEYDEQGDPVMLSTDIVNPVLDSLELAGGVASYASINSKAGAIDAIINNCICDQQIKLYNSTNVNWQILNCDLQDGINFKGNKGIVMNNTFGDSATVAGEYNTIEGNKGTRLSITGNYNTAIGNIIIGATNQCDGIYVQANHNNVIGNYVEGAGNGIRVKEGDQCTLIGNTCVNCTKNAALSNGYGIIIEYGAMNTRILSNYCAGNEIANIIVGSTGSAPLHTELIGNYAANGTHYGIVIMTASHYTLLLGNLAYGNVNPGIWLENAHHCVIKGNLVYDNQVAEHGEGGITLHSNVDYCVLEGNKCFDTQDPKTQKYGIDIYNANCDANIIMGNDVRNNLTAGIHDAGTGTIIRNNLGYNPVGIASISVGESPFTHTAGASPETVYVSGGTVSSITKGGQ